MDENPRHTGLMDLQADLSLCWSSRSYCRFYRALTHLLKGGKSIRCIQSMKVHVNILFCSLLRSNLSKHPLPVYTPTHESCGISWYHVGCPCVRPSVVRPSVPSSVRIFVSGQ